MRPPAPSDISRFCHFLGRAQRGGCEDAQGTWPPRRLCHHSRHHDGIRWIISVLAAPRLHCVVCILHRSWDGSWQQVFICSRALSRHLHFTQGSAERCRLCGLLLGGLGPLWSALPYRSPLLCRTGHRHPSFRLFSQNPWSSNFSYAEIPRWFTKSITTSQLDNRRIAISLNSVMVIWKIHEIEYITKQ